MKKSSKHTKQSFNDQHAIGLLSAMIASTHRAMPDLKANDKWPNIDGLIELTDGMGRPLGILKIQVKKLTKKQAKSRSYTFSKKDNFLDYCRESQDWVPIILIGVDIENEMAYWLHMDRDYLAANGSSRTIKFVDKQIIGKTSQVFIDEWERLIDLYNTKSSFFDQYKHAYSMLADVITPALGKKDPRFLIIHHFLDHINYLLDHMFPAIKKVYYPGTWKLGFAMYKFTKKEAVYSLYPIAEDRNDIQIKEVDRSLHGFLEDKGLEFSMHFGNNPIAENTYQAALEVVKEKVFNVVRARALDHVGDSFLAREFLFAFIDRFHVQLGLVKKDTYELQEVEYGFYTYLPTWLKEAYDLLISLKRNNIEDRVKRNGYYDVDILGEIMDVEIDQINEAVAERLKSDPITPSVFISNSQGLSVGLFREFLNAIKQQNFKEIERVYRPRDYQRGGSFLYKTLSDEDATYNIQQIINNYEPSYEMLIANNFPRLGKELSLYDGFDKILYSLDLTDRENMGRDGPRLNRHGLVSQSKNSSKELKMVDLTTSSKFLSNRFVTRDVEYEGEMYDSYNGASIPHFLYEDTPLLSLLYSTLTERIEGYFKET